MSTLFWFAEVLVVVSPWHVGPLDISRQRVGARDSEGMCPLTQNPHMWCLLIFYYIIQLILIDPDFVLNHNILQTLSHRQCNNNITESDVAQEVHDVVNFA